MTDMFYGAKPPIFRNAEKLRKNITLAEKKIWNALSNKKLNGFRFKNQHPVATFIVDFYCHKAKLVIEIDGLVHALREQSDYDIGRTNDIESLGLRVIRFTNEQVEEQLEEVLHIIKSYCQA